MQADQKKMPLVAAMLKYKKEQVYPFHTPGHKGGRGMLKGAYFRIRSISETKFLSFCCLSLRNN